MTKLPLTLLLLLCGIHVMSQPQAYKQQLEGIIDQIDNFNHLYPQEKVYLHFDNTGYFLGERIWFKAYLTEASTLQASPFSKVLYVELLTPEGDVLETKKYKVEKGMTHGDFILKDSFYAGYYEVRAYTRAMLNFGDEVVFRRVFPVFDSAKAGNYQARKMTVRANRNRVVFKRTKSPDYSAIHLDFYPEGGNLVANISNRVAFKAVNKTGQNIAVTGTLYDSSGKEISSFSSLHLGMGSFEFVPELAAGKYYVIVESAGKQEKIRLPDVQASGYTLRANNLQAENLVVQMEKTKDIPAQLVGLSVSCRGKVYHSVPLMMGNEAHTLKLPKAGLPSGVVQLTLFTPTGAVLADRLVFIDHQQTAVIQATVPDSLAPYQAVTIDFEVLDHQQQAVETTFSLAVRNHSTLIDTYYSDDISTAMLLSSDLKGYIENPAWYFSSTDTERLLSLDLLLMVQGWRRYCQEQMAGVKPFEAKYGIEPFLIIEGHVSSIVPKKPQKNIDVKMWMLNMKEGASQQGKCVTDKEGKFNFALEDLYGKWQLNLQTSRKNKPKFLNIILNRNISPAPNYYSFYENTLPEIQESADRNSKKKELIQTTSLPKGLLLKKEEDASILLVEDSIKSHLLKEVEVKRKKIPMQEIIRRHANIVLNVPQELDKITDDNKYYVNKVKDFLLQTNDNFSLIGTASGIKFRYKLRGVNFHFDGSSPVATDGINTLLLSDVESIVIAEYDPFDLSSGGGTPAAVFITLKDPSKNPKEPRGIRQTTYAGYNRPSEFFNPDYTYYSLPPEKDFRRTLYWNPNVTTDKNGKASVRFFNNGDCRELNISAEGMTSEGRTVGMKSEE